jgi:hypothetical protein
MGAEQLERSVDEVDLHWPPEDTGTSVPELSVRAW